MSLLTYIPVVQSVRESSFVWASSFIHCLAALEFGAGVEQPFGCFIVQNRQAVQSVGRSMDWTLEDDRVDHLLFCATLTGRRGGHALPHLYPPHSNSSASLTTTTYVRRSGRIINGMQSGRTSPQDSALLFQTPVPNPRNDPPKKSRDPA